jgi:hypothetical protein
MQEARLLPGLDYFLVTFTIPDTLWPACRAHPAELYDLLLRESAGALQDVAQTKLAGRLGFTTILHTCGRQMQHTADGLIKLAWQNSTTKQWGVAKLSIDTFLDRFLTHVLPKGFVRVRHCGWLSGAARKTRLLVRALLCGELDEPKPKLPEPPQPLCPDCGALMAVVGRLEPLQFKRGPPPSSPAPKP